MKSFHRAAFLVCSGALLLALPGCADSNQTPPPIQTQSRADAAQNKAYEADNTGRNAGDENRATPGDQGTSDTDITVTQQIRQALVDENSFSVNAKNVKVITRDGKVTLRGPVVDATEKSRIEAIAERIAGTGNVSNQIELETPKS